MLQEKSDEGLTQAEAAERLNMSPTHINNYIKAYGIHWRVKRQGQHKGVKNEA